MIFQDSRNLFFFHLPIIFCMHILLLMKIYASNLMQSLYLAYFETQASTVELSFVFRSSFSVYFLQQMKLLLLPNPLLILLFFLFLLFITIYYFTLFYKKCISSLHYEHILLTRCAFTLYLNSYIMHLLNIKCHYTTAKLINHE